STLFPYTTLFRSKASYLLSITSRKIIQMLNRFNVAWRKQKCALLDFVLFHFGIVYVIHLLPKDRCIEVAMMKWIVANDCANMSVRDSLREKQSFSIRILISIKTVSVIIYVNVMTL